MRCYVLLFLVFVLAEQSPVVQLEPSQTPIGPEYFGMHVHHGERTWPTVPFHSWRLWDTRVAWAQLEPKRGEWHFEELDQDIKLASAHDVQVLLTFGLTPAWASARPAEESKGYEPGNAAEPRNIEDWRTFVHTVGVRYKGRIHSYDLWNESNLKQYFSGSIEQLVAMNREAYTILKKIDPTITIVCPSGAGSDLKWMDKYFAAGGGQYCDVIGYHFYVFPKDPEQIVELAIRLRNLMRQHGIGGKPIWDTEIGWHGNEFTKADDAAGYVARTLILNWAAGISRVYWYAWDNYNWVSLRMTEHDGSAALPAAVAYGRIEHWLQGSTMRYCNQKTDGTWECGLERDGHPFWIVWNDSGKAEFIIPKSWKVHEYQRVLQERSEQIPGQSIEISGSPVLID